MKKTLLSLALVICTQMNAQNLSDVLRYSQTSLNGSARFTAMGGAFGAVGGDFSAMEINPAGSSIFAFSEAGITLDSRQLTNNSSYFEGRGKDTNISLNTGQLGIVLLLNETTGSGWSKVAFGFSYNKINDFDSSFAVQGTNPQNGIDQYFLFHAQGRYLDQISQLDDEEFNDAYLDIGEAPELGYSAQQALFGYEGYVLNPIPLEGSDDLLNPDINRYASNARPGTNGYTQKYNHTASGHTRKYTFNLSSSFQDRFYIGLNINSYAVSYSEIADFRESGYSSSSGLQSLHFNNALNTNGSGGSFQLGMIYKLNPKVRLGLSLNSPTYYRLTDRAYQFLNSEASTQEGNITVRLDPGIDIIFPEYRFNSPGSVRGSFSYIIGDKGLISVDYSQKNLSNATFRSIDFDLIDSFDALNKLIENEFAPTKTLQIGGEYRITPFLSLRAGYVSEDASQAGFDNSRTVVSAGFGYSFGASTLDLSLQMQSFANERPLFSQGLTDTVLLDRENRNLRITYRVKL